MKDRASPKRNTAQPAEREASSDETRRFAGYPAHAKIGDLSEPNGASISYLLATREAPNWVEMNSA